MNNLQKIFAGSRKVLIIFECAGAPDLQESSLRIKTLLDAGADIVELALPFSDPIADGAAAQAAYLAALNNGATTAKIIDMCRDIRKSFPEAGIVVSGYCNVFMQYGYEKIFSELAEIKADAVRILDLPFEEYTEIAPYLEKYGLALAVSVGKNSTVERIRQLLTQPAALIYCDTPGKIAEIKILSDLPTVSFDNSADAMHTGERAVAVPRQALAEFVKQCRSEL